MGMKKFLKSNVGFLFILPWLIGFLVFKLYPFAASLFYSFTDYQLFEGITKYTVENYVDIFTTPKIVKALKVTFQYSFMTVPLKLVAALFIAYILNFKIEGVNFFRTAYYIPSILGGSVAIAVLWKAIFKDDGLLNTLIGFFGVKGPSWLSDPSYALFVICLLRVWQFGSAMVIFLAALKGGPRNSTTLISLLIYNSAFKNYEMGMASAMAWVLFIILMVFTVIAFLSQKYWVYYSDEEGR